ncbi:MAG: hypothetical protein ACAH59_07660 [Pseudobdellovibrionaceae bacterium]
MATNVYMPQRQQQSDELGKLLQIGGAIGGGIIGGPAGIAAGAGLGGTAAGILGPPAQVQAPNSVDIGGSDALQRRMQKLQENPQMQIAQSIDSLKYIQDPQMRADLAKPLLQADYMARNKVG